MISYYNTVDIEELDNRLDSKMLRYKQKLKTPKTTYKIMKIGKLIEQVNSPAILKDGIEYKYYDTSVESVNEKGEFNSYKIIDSKNRPSRAKQVAVRDTIIVANMKTNKGKAAIVTEKEEGSIISSGYLIIKPKEELDIEYLKVVLQSEFILYYLRQIASTGIGMSNWSFKDLADIKIVVPSIEEQKNSLKTINEKIESLSCKIRQLEKEKEKNSLQNVIDRVFEEELNIAIPDINALQSSKYTYSSAHNMQDRLDFNYMVYKNSIEQKNDLLYEKIGKVAKINDTPIIKKGTSIDGQSIDFKEIIPYSGLIGTEVEPMQYKLEGDKTPFKGNDIMFSKFNPQFGNNVIVTKENECCVGSLELWGLNINKERVDLQYFIYALSTKRMIVSFCYLVTGAKLILDGNGRSRITQKQFYDLSIPLPSIDKQKEIILKISKELNVCNEIDKQIKDIQNTIDTDLNRYILNGYSEDLFNLVKGE